VLQVFYARRFPEVEACSKLDDEVEQLRELGFIRKLEGGRFAPTKLGLLAWGAGSLERLPRSVSALSLEDSVNVILHILEQSREAKELRGDPRISRPGQLLVEDLQRWSRAYGVTGSKFRIALAFLVRMRFVVLTPLDVENVDADRAALVRGRSLDDMAIQKWPKIDVPLRTAFIESLARPHRWAPGMLRKSLLWLLSEAAAPIEQRIHQIARTCDREFVLRRASAGDSPQSGMSLRMIEGFMRWIYPHMREAKETEDKTMPRWEAILSRLDAADRSKLHRQVRRHRLLQCTWFSRAVIPLLEEGAIRVERSGSESLNGRSPALVLSLTLQAETDYALKLPRSARAEADAERAQDAAKQRAREARRQGREATRDADIRRQALTSLVAEEKEKEAAMLDDLAHWFAAAPGDGNPKSATPPISQGYTTADIAKLAGITRNMVLRYVRMAGVVGPRRGQRNFRYSLEAVRSVLSTIQQRCRDRRVRSKCSSSLRELPPLPTT
jgi:hypothetical protein